MRRKLSNDGISGVLFDLDNTLVSCTMNFELMRQSIHCPPNQDVLSFVESLPLVEQQRASQLIKQIEIDDADNTVLMPGALSLLTFLAKSKIPTGIITRNCGEAAEKKLALTGLSTDLLFTRENFPAKPDPTALLQASSLWTLPPAQILFVGDYLYDLQAAYNASMPSALVHQPESIEFINQATIHALDLDSLKTKLKPLIERKLVDL